MLERRKEEKKNSSDCGKTKTKKDKKSNYTRNLLTGFRDTINNNSSTTEQKVVESGLLQSLFEFYYCLIEVMLHESCLLSCLCGSSEKQLAP